MEEHLDTLSKLEDDIARAHSLKNQLIAQRGVSRTLAIQLENIGLQINKNLYPETGVTQHYYPEIIRYMDSYISKNTDEIISVIDKCAEQIVKEINDKPSFFTILDGIAKLTTLVNSPEIDIWLQEKTYNAGDVFERAAGVYRFSFVDTNTDNKLLKDPDVSIQFLVGLLMEISKGNYVVNDIGDIISTEGYLIEQEVIDIIRMGKLRAFIETVHDTVAKQLKILDDPESYSNSAMSSIVKDITRTLTNVRLIKKHIVLFLEDAYEKYSKIV